jgi:carboxylesterase
MDESMSQLGDPVLRRKESAAARLAWAAAWGALAGAAAGGLTAWGTAATLIALPGPDVAGTVLFGSACGALAAVIGRAVGAVVRRRRWRVLLAVGAGLPALWSATDLAYAILIRRSYDRWEAGTARDPDGVRRGCEGFTVGRGDTAFLVVHGLGDSPAAYRRMAGALAARGFTCEALRLPGFAMPLDDYRRTSAAQWRRALAAHLAALRATHRRVLLVGHSLGGAVVVDYLADHPEAADGAVLVAPLVDVSGAGSPLLGPETWYTLLDRLLIFTDRLGAPLPEDIAGPRAGGEAATDPFLPRAIYRQVFPLLRRNRERVRSFSTLQLMALARRDAVIDNGAAEDFYRDCAARCKRLLMLEHSGHVIPRDADWRELVDEMAIFGGDLPRAEALAVRARARAPALP